MLRRRPRDRPRDSLKATVRSCPLLAEIVTTFPTSRPASRRPRPGIDMTVTGHRLHPAARLGQLLPGLASLLLAQRPAPAVPQCVSAVARVRREAPRVLWVAVGSRPAPGPATESGPAGRGAWTGPRPDRRAPSPPARRWPSGPRTRPAASRSGGP